MTTAPTSRQHDFRRTGWGHSWYVRAAGEEGQMQGLTHCTPGPREGDTAVWRTSYGEAVGRFDKVRWKGDPDDMYEVRLTIIKRREADGGAVLWRLEDQQPV